MEYIEKFSKSVSQIFRFCEDFTNFHKESTKKHIHRFFGYHFASASEIVIIDLYKMC